MKVSSAAPTESEHRRCRERESTQKRDKRKTESRKREPGHKITKPKKAIIKLLDASNLPVVSKMKFLMRHFSTIESHVNENLKRGKQRR